MRLISMSLLLALNACEPVVTGTVDLPSDTDVLDTDTDTDTDTQVPSLPCDGSYLPEIPAVPTDLPELLSESGRLADARWSPAQPADPLDPSDPDFDPPAALPDDFPFFTDADWPTIPEDPRDLSGALLQERSFGADHWEPIGAIRLDEQGWIIADYELDEQGRARIVTLWRHGQDRSASVELFYRGDTIASMARSARITSGDWSWSVEQRFPVNSNDPDTTWGEIREEVSRLEPGNTPRRGDTVRVVVRREADLAGGQWTRWMDSGEDEAWGARVYAYEGGLQFVGAQVRLDDRQTLIDFVRNQVISEVLCPSADPDTPPDQVTAWTVNGRLAIVTRRAYDGPRSYRDERDEDADGIFDNGYTVIHDAATGEQRTESWILNEDGEREINGTSTARVSAAGVILSQVSEHGESIMITRTTPIE